MQNRPLITWDATDFEESDEFAAAGNDSPVVRFWLLLIVLLVPLAAIGARLAQLQGYRGQRYVEAWETTTIREEPLPCRDGRILSADGQVLAQDRLRFDVLVHYRWLEEPTDDSWLAQQSLSRLTRRQRRDTAAIAVAKQKVLDQRQRLWELLATTTGLSQQQLQSERLRVQQRIERIVTSVNQRREERDAPTPVRTASVGPLDQLKQLAENPEDIRQLGESLVSELTTPPQRSSGEAIIVAEELGHHAVIRDVDLQTVAAIESAPSLFPGVRIQAVSERIYPAADMAAHIVGVRTDATPEETTTDGSTSPTGLEPGDRIGRIGIERSCDQTLRGRRGRLRFITDRHGEILSQSVVEQPAHGRDVVLTIDAGLQRSAEALLDEAIGTVDPQTGRPTEAAGGCLIVLDVRTGDVVTAAAAPRFDLGLLLHPDPEEWQAAVDDPRRPFFPRITQMTVPPGSVFKILTAIALLESRLIDPSAPVFCQGFLDRPDRNRCYIYRHYGIGHGDMTLSDAICQSCNVYFFHAARSLGPQPIADWAARFGLGIATGGEVPGEKDGHLPRTDAAGKIVGEQWYNGSTLQFAIGQASLTVTPMQIARMVAAVANDGYLVTPRFVSDGAATPAESASSANDIAQVSYTPNASAAPPRQRIAGLSPGTLKSVRDGMRLVVEDRKGTGKRVRLDNLAIAGKTGTAEVGGGKRDHAWFVGFVPADAPKYAFVIVLEHGGSGGSAAAPLAKTFIEIMLDAGVLTPTTPESASDS